MRGKNCCIEESWDLNRAVFPLTRHRVLNSSVLIFLLMLFSAFTIAQAESLPYQPGVLMVRFVDGGSSAEDIDARKQALSDAGGGTIKSMYKVASGLALVELPEGVTVEQALDRFNNTTGILYAEPNYEYKLFAQQVFPDDPDFTQQWALHNTGQTGGTQDADIDAPEAWSIQTGGGTIPPVVVAVLDSGVDYTHPDLNQNMWVNFWELFGGDNYDVIRLGQLRKRR